MKYKIDKVLCTYTTADGHYRIEKRFGAGCYMIKDLKAHRYLEITEIKGREWVGIGNACFGYLRDAKKALETSFYM